jgi:hypothetical protein
MRAFYTDLNDLSAWGLASREYLRLVCAMGPYVVRHLLETNAPWVTGAVRNQAIRVLDTGTTRVLQGQGEWINPPTMTFYHGQLADLERLKHVFTPPGGSSVAIANWPGVELPGLEDRAGLDRFTAVWVSTPAQCAQLRDAGLRAYCVPVPLASGLEIARLPREGQRMIVAIGSWHAPDDLKGITQAFLRAFRPVDDYGLHLVCSDLSSLEADYLRQLDGLDRPFAELPPVSVAPAPPNSSEAWLNLFAYCDTYYSARDDNAGDYLALLAGQAGCKVAGKRAMAESYRSIEGSSQCHRFPDGAGHQESLQHVAGGWVGGADPGELAVDRGERAFADAVVSTVDTAAAIRPQPELRLGVVIAHRDQGFDRLGATLRCLCPQLLEDDILVVSDRSDDRLYVEQARSAAERYGAEFGAWMGPADAPWSWAWCRNYGARIALEHGAEVLLFVDCDVLLPQSAVWLLRYHIEGLGTGLGAGGGLPRDCAVATICASDELLTADQLDSRLGGDWPNGKSRSTTAPGHLMVRSDLFTKLRGFDEAYAGRGYEDLDFRLRSVDHAALWVEEVSVVACRQPGTKATAFPDVSSERAAEARFKVREAGKQEEINPRGWGHL